METKKKQPVSKVRGLNKSLEWRLQRALDRAVRSGGKGCPSACLEDSQQCEHKEPHEILGGQHSANDVDVCMSASSWVLYTQHL